jgi:hypothetical protein
MIRHSPPAESHSFIKVLKTIVDRAKSKHQGKHRAIRNSSLDLALFYVLPTLR